jgi:flagellar M-ring protein FliF
MNRLLANLKAFGAIRLASIAGVGLVVMAIVGVIALRANIEPMALLYGDLDLQDSGRVTAILDKLHVGYEIKGGGSQIMVPTGQVDRLRLSLAREGVPAGGSVGYEVFDRGDGLTSSQFQQDMNQLRALEGELSRTVKTIRGVRNARVHLVLHKREPFAREQQEAQASVLLDMAGAQRMDKDEVQAILNLVASAVPGLKAQNISIVDTRGGLLARSGRQSGPEGAAQSNEELRHGMEKRLTEETEDMLTRMLGAGHVRVQTSVEVDFARSNEVQEKFDPDGQVARTLQSTTDADKNTEAQPSVTVQNNLPNADQQNTASGSSTNRQEESSSFEIGKTTRTTVRDTPSIRKISMAVMVDGTMRPGPDGKPIWQERSQADLDRMAILVKSAIGFDESRGDHVEIVNLRFAAAEETLDAPPPGLLGLQLGKSDIIWLVSTGLAAAVAIFALLFVVRPLALKLATATPLAAPLESPPAQLAGQAALALAGPTDSASLGTEVALSPSATATHAEEDDTLLNVANVEGRLRASSIRKLGQIVDDHPETALTVVRGWLNARTA